MKADLFDRADRVIGRYVEKRAKYRKEHPISQEKMSHDLFLAEVPNLSDKINLAINSFNDRASDTNLRITVYVDNAPHFSVTIFKLSVVGVFDPKLELSFTVDHDGSVIGFIRGNGDTERLLKVSIMEISQDEIFAILLDLVERELNLHFP